MITQWMSIISNNWQIKVWLKNKYQLIYQWVGISLHDNLMKNKKVNNVLKVLKIIYQTSPNV
jgi:hypothetical protein